MISMEQITRTTLRSSVLWGALAAVGFYVAVDQLEDWLHPLFLRYAAGRWEAYVCVSLFFIGLAAIAIKCVDLFQDWLFYFRLNLGMPTLADNRLGGVKSLLRTLGEQPRLAQGTCLIRRLRDACNYILYRGGDAELENHLRYLADLDTARMNTSYGMPRFLCWAIPAIGSLGTVLAIAMAIGELSLPAPVATVESAQAVPPVFNSVTSSLALAFDTLGLALGLSIVLMLGRFACEQTESYLLDAVEQRAERELVERIGSLTPAPTTQTNSSDHFRVLAQRLGELTEKMGKATTAPATAVAASGGLGDDQIESIVSRAVAKAVASTPTISLGGGGQFTDMGQVQDALKQIAAFFSIQQAEHQQESEIVQQLSEIIQESESNWKPRKHNESSGSSLAGLWNALSD